MDWAGAHLLSWQGERIQVGIRIPAGGEFVEPFSVQDSPQDQVPCPELPTMHKPLVIVSECLVVTFISDCNSPPPFINEIHIISSQLFLHRLIKCLDPW